LIVDQSTHATAPVSDIKPKVLVVGDSGTGKSTFIQLYLSNAAKRVKIEPTKQTYYYDANEFQFVDGSDTDSSCVVLVFNTQSEATLTSLKTKWMPQLQKQVSKATVKHGLVLVGLSFTAE